MGQLLLRRRGHDLVYTLDGVDVTSGETLELRRSNGSWIRGRFVWDGDAYRAPVMEIPAGGGDEAVELTPDSSVRRGTSRGFDLRTQRNLGHA